jgi:hypothetical protein
VAEAQQQHLSGDQLEKDQAYLKFMHFILEL